MHRVSDKVLVAAAKRSTRGDVSWRCKHNLNVLVKSWLRLIHKEPVGMGCATRFMTFQVFVPAHFVVMDSNNVPVGFLAQGP